MTVIHSEMIGLLDRFDIPYELKNNHAYLLDHDSFDINLEKDYWKRYKTGDWGHMKPFTDKEGTYHASFSEYLADELDYDIPKDVDVDKKDRARVVIKPVKPFNEKDLYFASNDRDSYKYLMGRGIDKDLIKRLLQKKLIGTDIHHNLNYYWKNADGKIVGEDIQGTSFDKSMNARGSLKLIASGSEKFFGFNFKTVPDPETIVAFEAPIDLLSYYQLHQDSLKNHKVTFVSLSGAAQKASTIPNMVRQMNWKNIKMIVVGTDKDEAGEAAYDAISNVCKTTNELKDVKVVRIRPQVGKDWNDQLKHDKFGWKPNKDGSNEHEAPKEVSLESPSR